MMSDNIILDL